MRRKCLIFLVLSGVFLRGLAAQRSFDGLYAPEEGPPGPEVFSYDGIKAISDMPADPRLIPETNSELSRAVFDREPAFIIETLRVVPYRGRPASLLDVYRAVNRLSTLKDQAALSAGKNERGIPIFEESGRVQSASKTAVVPDLPPPASVPSAETLFIKVKDADFGNSYYRVDFVRTENGLHCTIANLKRLTMGIIPVIKEGNFIAEIYIEPLEEGLCVYSISSVVVSDFISSRADIAGSATTRIDVIIEWLVNGTL